MNLDQLVGSWLIIKSELPSPYAVGEEVLHFDGNGRYYWEVLYVSPKAGWTTFRFKVQESPDGFMIKGGTGDKWRNLPARFDEGPLMITGPHGYRSWLRRISKEEREGPLKDLKHFFE